MLYNPKFGTIYDNNWKPTVNSPENSIVFGIQGGKGGDMGEKSHSGQVIVKEVATKESLSFPANYRQLTGVAIGTINDAGHAIKAVNTGNLTFSMKYEFSQTISGTSSGYKTYQSGKFFDCSDVSSSGIADGSGITGGHNFSVNPTGFGSFLSLAVDQDFQTTKKYYPLSSASENSIIKFDLDFASFDNILFVYVMDIDVSTIGVNTDDYIISKLSKSNFSTKEQIDTLFTGQGLNIKITSENDPETLNSIKFKADGLGMKTATPFNSQDLVRNGGREYRTNQYSTDGLKKIRDKTKFVVLSHQYLDGQFKIADNFGYSVSKSNVNNLTASKKPDFEGEAADNFYLYFGLKNSSTKIDLNLYELLIYKDINNFETVKAQIIDNLIEKYQDRLLFNNATGMNGWSELTPTGVYYSNVDRVKLFGKLIGS
jgi:hypothetical protein